MEAECKNCQKPWKIQKMITLLQIAAFNMSNTETVFVDLSDETSANFEKFIVPLCSWNLKDNRILEN